MQKAAIAPGLFSILCGSTVVAQLSCACIVLGHGFTTRTASNLTIGAAYLFAGLLGTEYLLANPNLTAPMTAFERGDATAPYLWLLWHAAFSEIVAVAVVVAIVNRDDRRLPPLATVLGTAGIAGLASLVALYAPAVARNMHSYLPAAASFGQFGDATQLGIARMICASDIVAIAAILVLGRLKASLSRTLALGLFASVVDMLVSLTARPDSYGWYAGTLFTTVASSVILIAFVSEFTLLRAIENAKEAYSNSNARERERTQERLLYLAYHDELTGMHNRTHWQDVLRRHISAAENVEGPTELAVLFVDLDRFKEVNDAAGHAHGDALLIGAAARLRDCAGGRDAVGRLGGDEFAIVCDGTDPDILAQRILAALRAPFVIDRRSSELSATIGIARYPEDGVSVEELLRNADQALYHGKRRGGDSFNRYDARMSEERRSRRIVREALLGALPNKEFTLAYQPIFDFKTLESESVEALLRWHNEALGSIPPTVFIGVAEETDLMRDIGRWALEAAIAQLRSWHRFRAEGMPTRVAVNVSARQLRDPQFFEHLTGLLRRYDVGANRLELEITESAAMADTDAAVELLGRCRKLGIHVTLDDFGTHYSSLTYLQRLPIDTIKIDRSFVAGLPFEDGDAAIVRNIINLGHDMRRTIVAEGIETREQFEWLQRAGCDYAQGFLLARPMLHDEIAQRVSAKLAQRPAPRPQHPSAGKAAIR
ncbi:MAG: hypothetical protein NVS3B16_12750 [Vulcanimicrobiaceae bacterium]